MTVQEEINKYIIESVSYKGWINTYAGNNKIVFKKIEKKIMVILSWDKNVDSIAGIRKIGFKMLG